MDIGEPQRKIVVEPIRNPVPERTPEPHEQPAEPSRLEPSQPEPVRTGGD